MLRKMAFFSVLMGIFFGSCMADTVVWKGEVSSDGTATDSIKIELKQKYKIKVSGFINLGKWIQNREKLANDACYEFSNDKSLSKNESIKNSNNISVCADGKFHPDHVYTSEIFTAKQNRIFFWVVDTNYDDNSGSFQVEVIKVD